MVQNHTVDVMSALFPVPDTTPDFSKEKTLKEKERKKVKKRIDFQNIEIGEGISTGASLKRSKTIPKEMSENTLRKAITKNHSDGKISQKGGGHHRLVSNPIPINKITDNHKGCIDQSRRRNSGLDSRQNTGGKTSEQAADCHFLHVQCRQSPVNYAGAKFSESPSAKVLPPPPIHWVLENLDISDMDGQASLSSFGYIVQRESHPVRILA